MTIFLIGFFSQMGHSQHQESIFGISKIVILDDSSFIYNNTQRISNDLTFVRKTEVFSGVGIPPLLSHSRLYTKFNDQLRFPMNYAIFGRNVFTVHANSQSLVSGVIEWSYGVASYNIDSGVFLHSDNRMSSPSFGLHFHSALPINHPLKISKNRPYYDLVVENARYLLIISTGQEIFVLESQDPCNFDCEKPFLEKPNPCVDEWYFIKRFEIDSADNELSNQLGYFRVYIDNSNQIVLAYNNGQSYAMDLKNGLLKEIDMPSVEGSTLVFDSRSGRYYWITKELAENLIKTNRFIKYIKAKK